MQYPGAWKITPDQGTQYISDHGYNGNKFGKPVVMEVHRSISWRPHLNPS